MKKFRYLLFSILLVILSTCMVMAEVPSTKNRDGSNNFGVNKRWKITEKNKRNILDTPYVNAGESIYDFSGLLTEDEIRMLKEEIDAFHKKYDTEIVILTYSLTYTEDKDNEDFAADFYDYNDFGIDYKNYDGILLFRNTYSYDPYYDMYTFGEAQFYFPYDSGRYDIILDGIYNDIHNGNYYKGFHEFIQYVDHYYEQGKPKEAKNYYLNKNGYIVKKYKPNWLIIIGLTALVNFITISAFINRNKMVRKSTEANDYIDKSTIKVNAKNNLVNTVVTHHTVSSSSGGGSGGGGSYHSSGGSSGGGHSSGGGRHG